MFRRWLRGTNKPLLGRGCTVAVVTAFQATPEPEAPLPMERVVVICDASSTPLPQPSAGHRATAAGISKLSNAALTGAVVGVTTARAAPGLEHPPQPCKPKVRQSDENRQRKIARTLFGCTNQP